MKLGLIVVDIQNDYFKGGRYELINPEKAALQANKILTFFREKGWPIYHVRHINVKTDAAFFIPGTAGSEFYRECCPFEGEEIIIKHRPDSFLNTNLNEKLIEKGVDTLVICGMMTHMCIDTTVRAASNYGYTVTLIEDACATRDLEWNGSTVPANQVQNSYLAALHGIFAKVLKADMWIKEQ
ncbi:MAG: isochorismatase hydrolase [Herbinix sp.]|jgi:nicotinamidase-related amidase|nr:isochorismatase hydrolase [Herbinix sp.]